MPRISVGLDKPDGAYVVLTIDGTPFRMKYDDANRLAVLIRGYGKMAKANSRDCSLSFIGFANLTDGNLDELKIQRRRDGTAAFKLVK